MSTLKVNTLDTVTGTTIATASGKTIKMPDVRILKSVLLGKNSN